MNRPVPDFTILGGKGFIGSGLVANLAAQGASVWAPPRDESLYDRNLGHVIYCVGLTADFRRRPFDTVRAHVGHLQTVLEGANFDSLLYLSTTRIYQAVECTDEDTPVQLEPGRADHLYDISKLMGESLCLSSGRGNVRVVRLSNVYGLEDRSENFLAAVLRDAVGRAEVVMRTSPDSVKDYVDIADVVDLLPRIAKDARHRIYNVASGENVSHASVLNVVQAATGCSVVWTPNAPTVTFPRIVVARVQEEFGWSPGTVTERLPRVISDYKVQHLS